ncbi:hypothetical protein C1645_834628 [Glomus cerebriforme]|uniref:BTB domain-containing protein n=1 Tax=Glomus cerebriforme TaxID=658196 RepID=A0A397S978_9GLOM|nr:hypothetical protein C1645_834628 [Glomus cerebriforme]
MNDKLLTKLSQNLLEILDDDEYYDITIEVGNDPYIKIFHAHMVILYYRSPYLRRILSTNKKKNDGTLEHIKLPNILPETFQIILRYIYGGKISLKEYDTSDIIKMLVAASELNLQDLITYLQFFLIENKTNWLELNFNLIYQTSFENNSFLELQQYCTDLISKEPDKILKSLNFSSIPEKLLISLIQGDNFQINEIQVWEHVLKWGLAQNPGLPSDPIDFSKEDFNALKNSLHQCIPFIRFHNLASEEFSDKVLPYKKILPKELYKDLLKYFLNPNNQSIKKSKRRSQKESLEKNNLEDSLETCFGKIELSSNDSKESISSKIEKKKESYKEEKVENTEISQAAFAQSFGQPSFGQSFQAQPAFGQEGFEQQRAQSSSLGQSGFGQPAFGQAGIGQPTFGQSGFGQPAFGQIDMGQPTFGQSGFGQPTFEQSGFGKPVFGQVGLGSPSPLKITALKIPSGGGFARFASGDNGGNSNGFGSTSIASTSVFTTSSDPKWSQFRK